MYGPRAPRLRAASTNSRSRSDSVWPADNPAHVRPAEEPDDEDQHGYSQRVAVQAEGTARQDANQGDREHKQREGQEDVHGPGDQGVHPAAEVAGDDAEENPDDDGEGGGQECDQQRVARAVHDPAEHVPPGLRLDTERVSQADAAELAVRAEQRRVEQVRVVGIRALHQERPDDGDQDQEEDEDAAAHGHLVTLQPQPGDLAKRAALDAPCRQALDDVLRAGSGFRRRYL